MMSGMYGDIRKKNSPRNWLQTAAENDDDNSQPTNPDRHRKDRIRVWVWGPLLHFLSAFVSLHRTQLTYIYMYILYSSR